MEVEQEEWEKEYRFQQEQYQAISQEVQEAEAEFERLMERARYFYERGELELGKQAMDQANSLTDRIVALYQKKMESRHSLILLSGKHRE